MNEIYNEMKKISILLLLTCWAVVGFAQNIRERINFDDDWLFAYGHPYNVEKDYNTGTSYFTYLAKAGYGDGAASASFDDRAWRPLNIPHDWAVEVPFDGSGSHSHGYKAIGRNFPDASVGWYRKHFDVKEADFGKQIFIDFDGVSRDAKVWVNGHYLGNEPSGYQSFGYNITDIINYGGDNVVSVRADVTMEEGWYYEGAGIYRHVWLSKTAPLHVMKNGTFVYSDIDGDRAEVSVETEVENRGKEITNFTVAQKLLDADGKVVAEAMSDEQSLVAMGKGKYKLSMSVANPHLWSIEDPYLHTVVTTISKGDKVVDEYQTRMGMRTVHFDAEKGFFLNGKHVKLKGTNNHQDHAGVGCAMPDELLRWRLQQLKNFGSNAIRSSHNPATPELLDLCDEMGILVIDENRLMGTTQEVFDELTRLIRRDRNHPSIFTWSMGNEEWGIECNVLGARVTETMEEFARTIDPTRPMNVAVSGGCNVGTSTTAEVMGYNYLGQWDTDKHHELFPDQPSMGTEEGSTFATRGIYFDDSEKQYMRAYDHLPRPTWETIETSWQHYAERDYLAGMFIWTGFDYRGEPTPYAWPSVTSYFGMMDLCGFAKDNVYYLKSWWQNEPVLHILPHWNWQGKEGDTIDVWVYSNSDEVELFLNDKSFGKQTMPVNGHLEWKVPYEAGTVKAISYAGGQKELEAVCKTTGEASQVNMASSKSELKGKNDIAMITVDALDKDGLHVATAGNDITFEIEGPGKIIGVGNGDPTSHEKEVFVDKYQKIILPEVGMVDKEDAVPQVASFSKKELKHLAKLDSVKVCYSSFILESEPESDQQFTWFFHHIGKNQRVYINGQLQNEALLEDDGEASLVINPELLHQGENKVVIITKPFKKKYEWDTPNKKPGVIQVVTPSEKAHRKLFNGLAQVIVESTGEKGEIILKASSEGLESKEIKIAVQ